MAADAAARVVATAHCALTVEATDLPATGAAVDDLYRELGRGR